MIPIIPPIAPMSLPPPHPSPSPSPTTGSNKQADHLIQRLPDAIAQALAYIQETYTRHISELVLLQTSIPGSQEHKRSDRLRRAAGALAPTIGRRIDTPYALSEVSIDLPPDLDAASLAATTLRLASKLSVDIDLPFSTRTLLAARAIESARREMEANDE